MQKRNSILSVFITLFLSVSFLSGCSDIEKSTNSNAHKTVVSEKEYDNDKSSRDSDEDSTFNVGDSTFIQVDVVKAVDGDTFYVRFQDGTEKKVRLIGVDTPESTIKKDPFGKESSEYTKDTILNKTVYLETDVSDTDRYDRLLRYLWLSVPDEINEDTIRRNMFNAILATNGYAKQATYPPDVKYVDYFGKFVEEARSKTLGLWALNNTTDSNTVAKGDTKVNSDTPNGIDTKYVITKSGKKYHEEGCSHIKIVKDYLTKEEAENLGYEPCKICFPQ